MGRIEGIYEKPLETMTKIQLRPFRTEDAEAVAGLCNNQKIYDNLRDLFPHPYTLQDARDFIRHCQVHDPVLNFAIQYKEELAGAVGLLPQTDVYTGTAEIGYWLGEPFWGKGIMAEAVRQMVDYGFNTLGLRRIFTGVFEHNRRSMRVLEKAGFVREGIAKKALVKNGIIRDEHRFAIIRETP